MREFMIKEKLDLYYWITIGFERLSFCLEYHLL